MSKSEPTVSRAVRIFLSMFRHMFGFVLPYSDISSNLHLS